MRERPREDLLVTMGATAIIFASGFALCIALANAGQTTRNNPASPMLDAAFAKSVGRF